MMDLKDSRPIHNGEMEEDVILKEEEVPSSMETDLPSHPSDDLTIDSLELPRSIVFRLAKAALPDGTLIQKDAKQVLARVATYFVSYLGATIIEKAAVVSTHTPKTTAKFDGKKGGGAPLSKVIITPDLIISALRDVDFDNFVKPLNALMAERRKKN